MKVYTAVSLILPVQKLSSTHNNSIMIVFNTSKISIVMEPKPKQRRYHCGHCDADLSKTQFYRHKSLFYDQRSKKWSSSHLPKCNWDDVPFSLSSSEEESDYASSFSLNLTLMKKKTHLQKVRLSYLIL